LRSVFILLFGLQVINAKAQTLGGTTTYNFLKLPSSPALTAMGGVNASYVLEDAGLASNNPALLSKKLHSQVALSFNSFFAGVKAYHLSGSIHQEKLNTSFGGSVFYIDYGRTPQADAAGNVSGDFRPRDYVFQVSASRKYLERWGYGFQAKLIQSNYGQYHSTGLAFDFGLLYSDTANQVSFGVLAKNMGYQLSTYDGFREDLPFDLQIGVTKKLSKAPLGFSLTAHQIHQWDLIYNDTLFNRENNFTAGSSSFSKFFNHIVLSTHVYAGKNLQFSIGYNRLRREELNLGSSGNGLNGFSAGFHAQFRKIQIQYSRAYFQRSYAYNQFGINLSMNELIGEKTL
jgi:hypothetical protein